MYMTEAELYDNLKSDPDAALSSQLMQYFLSQNDSSAIGKFWTFRTKIEALMDTIHSNDAAYLSAALGEAKEINASINDTLPYVTTQKKINRVYLKALEGGLTELDTNDLRFIEKLAVACPYVEGEGVYTARMLYNMISDEPITTSDEEACYPASSNKQEDTGDPIPPFADKLNTPLGKSDIKVFPNPSSDNFNFVLEGNLPTDASIEVFNVLGASVSKGSIKNRLGLINLEKQSPGVYSYRLTSDGHYIGEGKLIKAK